MKPSANPQAAREAVERALRDSGKHGRLSEDTLAWAAAWAVERSTNAKEAEKRAKRKLHQIAAGFAERRDLDRARRELASMASGASRDSATAGDGAGDERSGGGALGDAALREWCLRTMRRHASTAERLDSLEPTWAKLSAMADLPSARSVVDVGCGLNPLARPWMGLSAEARYDAIDIDGASIDVVADYFAVAGVAGSARRGNALFAQPTERVDVAILLKTVNNLDQQVDGAGEATLLAIPFDRAIVSFPALTLGGRDVGMRENYRARFEAFLARVGWRGESLDAESELYFVARR